MGTTAYGKQRESPLYQRLKNFTPAWHTINLGTGIVALLFLDFPYLNGYTAIEYITFIIHIVNCFLWVALTLCSLLRYVTYPAILRSTFRYPEHGLYVGAFPMSFAVIILGSALIFYDKFDWDSKAFAYALWGCWWIDMALSLLCCFGQLHIMISRQEMALESMTTLWLLPIVTLIVASSCGATLGKYLASYNNHQALYTIGVCLVLVICGTVSTFMINTIYLHRLVIYGLPQSTSIYSAFLPVGTYSQAALTLEKIGTVYGKVLNNSPPVNLFASPSIPSLIEFVCFAWCFSLWAFASAWAIGAIVSFLDIFRSQRLPFKITFWGLVFPNGSYASLTVRLGVILDSHFFLILGLVYSCLSIILWLIAVTFTGPGIWQGSAFQTPSKVLTTEMSQSSGKISCISVLHYESHDSSQGASRPSSVP